MSERHEIIPTPERARRGLDRVDLILTDAEGHAAGRAVAYRSIDVLRALRKRDAITVHQERAGERFREAFVRSHLDPLRAADLSRPMVSGKVTLGPGLAVERARRQVRDAMLVVGGAPASALWHVIGWEMSIKRWALERRMLASRATGVLIDGLAGLARHYGDG